ncbi:MAG: hypothetical protein JSW07_07240 [bacterium]|nr:MAG: hypothetical protein JSW07_07240 [bacterium]
MPNRAKQALKDEGINFNEIVELAEKQEVSGKILEIEQKSERIIVSIE